jgi:hypothetical protein
VAVGAVVRVALDEGPVVRVGVAVVVLPPAEPLNEKELVTRP